MTHRHPYPQTISPIYNLLFVKPSSLLALLPLPLGGLLLRLPLRRPLLIGLRIRLDRKEAIHPRLRLGRLLERLLELFDAALHAFGVEAAIVDQICFELVRLAFLPLEVDGGVGEDLVVIEEVSGSDVDRDKLLFVLVRFGFCRIFHILVVRIPFLLLLLLFRRPGPLPRLHRLVPLRHDVLLPVQILQYRLYISVLPHQFERRLWSDPSNRIAIIAPQQNAQIHELIVSQPQPRDGLGVVDLLHFRLRCVRERHLSHLNGGAERKRVHILGGRGVNLPRTGQSRGLSLRLARRLHHRHSHHLQ
mmetsp:Transcript_36568/g.88148  ORF Transcript_36568/g.88148 Transcript_36568/m.88148 type:complete len:304 (-) Transcript_36568:530-1441(-)